MSWRHWKFILISYFCPNETPRRMLEVKDGCLSLGGKTLFDGLNFVVREGEILCVTGTSGCGKTSLLRALLGFLPLDVGYITIDGDLMIPEVADILRRRMAYVPQEVALPYDDVRTMVRVPFMLKANADRPFTKRTLMAEWSRLGLDASLYGKAVSEVSGGERQRIMLSMATLLKKRYLLVDEPTSALDADTVSLVAAYFRHLATEGATIVVVSHDARLAAVADKTLNLEELGVRS